MRVAHAAQQQPLPAGVASSGALTGRPSVHAMPYPASSARSSGRPSRRAGVAAARGATPARRLGMPDSARCSPGTASRARRPPVTAPDDATPASKELLLGGVRDAQWVRCWSPGSAGSTSRSWGYRGGPGAGLLPVEATALLDELRTAPRLDRPALAGIISRFSRRLVDLPELAEIENDPRMPSPRAIAMDAHARLGV